MPHLIMCNGERENIFAAAKKVSLRHIQNCEITTQQVVPLIAKINRVKCIGVKIRFRPFRKYISFYFCYSSVNEFVPL